MTYRVWFLDGSARLVTGVDSRGAALARVQETYICRAQEISEEYQMCCDTDRHRATVLLQEWLASTIVTKLEALDSGLQPKGEDECHTECGSSMAQRGS
jgi:hypothetical protein